MNSVYYDMLHYVSEGIIVLDNQFNITFWNNYMQTITGLKSSSAIGKHIYSVLPNLNTNYFDQAFHSALNDGYEMFFSAAMHHSLVNEPYKLNVKIKCFVNEENNCLLIEFIDVTNQFMQIDHLQNFVLELSNLNKELKEKEKLIMNLAYNDSLTGVANRRLLYDLGNELLSKAKTNQTYVGLVFIDIDNFKYINDTYGHQSGDKVLIQIVNALKDATSKNDIIIRFGGDEFIILLPDLKDKEQYKKIIAKITSSKHKIVNLYGTNINLSLSIGVSLYPDSGEDIDELIIEADKAMYAMKKKIKQRL